MVRRYDPARSVDSEALRRVLDSGLRGPSAGFTQAVELVVLTGPEACGRFWRTQSDPGAPPAAEASAWLAGLRTAPVLVVITTSEQAYRERYAAKDKAGGGGPGRSWTAPYWDIDAGMSALLLLLAAVDEGLGACFFGLAGEAAAARLRTELGIPADRSLVGVVSLGHPAEDEHPSGSPTRRPRRPRAELLHDTTW